MIEQYQGNVFDLYQQLLADYTLYNQSVPDKWEQSYYLDLLTTSVEFKQCWQSGESVIAVADESLVYASWKGTEHEDFLFLLLVDDKFVDLTLIPLGQHLLDLQFIVNSTTLKKFLRHQVSHVRMDTLKYSRTMMEEYFPWEA